LHSTPSLFFKSDSILGSPQELTAHQNSTIPALSKGSTDLKIRPVPQVLPSPTPMLPTHSTSPEPPPELTAHPKFEASLSLHQDPTGLLTLFMQNAPPTPSTLQYHSRATENGAGLFGRLATSFSSPTTMHSDPRLFPTPRPYTNILCQGCR
jgi:hypothetical protein